MQGGLNSFGYVGGNPLKIIDLNGLFGTPESIFRDVMNSSSDNGFARGVRKIKSLCEISKPEGECILKCQGEEATAGILTGMMEPVEDGVVQDLGEQIGRDSSVVRGVIKKVNAAGTAITAYQLLLGCILECNE